MFIQLTRAAQGTPILINAASIVSVEAAKEGSWVHLNDPRMTGLEVRESYEDIAKILAPRKHLTIPSDISKLTDAELAQLYRDTIGATA